MTPAEWVRQTYEGRLNFKGATSTVEDVTGRKPKTLEMWVRANRQAVLSLHESLTARLGSGARVFRCIAFIKGHQRRDAVNFPSINHGSRPARADRAPTEKRTAFPVPCFFQRKIETL
jgi:hypothetical protein